MSEQRVVLTSVSAAMDGAFTAIAEVSQEMAASSGRDNHRLIGGVPSCSTSNGLASAMPIRATGDADFGVAPYVLREPGLVDSIEEAGYRKVAGNRWERPSITAGQHRSTFLSPPTEVGCGTRCGSDRSPRPHRETRHRRHLALPRDRRSRQRPANGLQAVSDATTSPEAPVAGARPKRDVSHRPHRRHVGPAGRQAPHTSPSALDGIGGLRIAALPQPRCDEATARTGS